jgi:hypothetical protein
MRWILGSLIIIFLIVLQANALRIPQSPVFTLPWDEGKINELNNYLSNISDLQEARYELGIYTTPKANAKEGEIWFIQTGLVVSIQYKANNRIYTLLPDS